ncbi:MAG TPA: glycosyltransferase [Candidatus Saccharimonadales bacterium]|nr:glycosyltransferase [Candidatus Saccharimonadales bacterium]
MGTVRNEWFGVEPKTTIVIPVWNEADNVLELVRRIKNAIAQRATEVLFVDDSKNDRTTKMILLARFGYSSPNFSVSVYHRTGKQRWGGLSGAVIDGIKEARSNQVIVMDGDLQHPPELIPKLIKAASSLDIVIASRYLKNGSARGLDGKIRHLVSRSSNWLAKTFFPIKLRKLSDPMTGYFLVNRRYLDLNRLRPKGFKILLEIVTTHHRLSQGEVPLKFAKRIAGKSHGNLKQGKQFLSQLLNLRFRRDQQYD